MSGSCKTITRINQVLSSDKLSIHHKFDWDTIIELYMVKKDMLQWYFRSYCSKCWGQRFGKPLHSGVYFQNSSLPDFSQNLPRNHQTWLFYEIVQLCKEAKFHVQAETLLQRIWPLSGFQDSKIPLLSTKQGPSSRDPGSPKFETHPKPAHRDIQTATCAKDKKNNTHTQLRATYICLTKWLVRLWVNGGTFS